MPRPPIETPIQILHRLAVSVRLTEDEREAIEVAIDALEEPAPAPTTRWITGGDE